MEIDALMNRFRLASRDLFNHHFHRSTCDGDPLDSSERFGEVEQALFRAMVTWPAGLREVEYSELQAEIRVASCTGRVAPCLASRKGGVWKEEIFPELAQLAFERFFDWEELSFRDNLYVRGQVVEWPGHADWIGLPVLIESQYVRFFQAKGVGSEV